MPPRSFCRPDSRAACAALALLAVLASPTLARADAAAPAVVGVPAIPAVPSSISWFAIPVAFYMPETRIGFGGIGGIHFRLEPALQTSDVQVLATATVKQQAALDLRTLFFPSEALALSAAFHLAVYPDLFYGVGHDAPASGKEAFTSRSLDAQVTSEWFLLPGRLRSGPRLWFRQEAFRGLAPGGQLASGGVAGAEDYAATGLGWGLTWDDRDSRFAPTHGSLVEAWYLLAPGLFGDRLSFGRAQLDARRFFALAGSMVLGLAGHLEGTHGDVPITLLARLGGDRNLRGYYEGRWRDRFAYSAQGELRFPVAGRFAGVVFAGISDVAPRPSAFDARTIRPAAGLGARYRLTADGVNVRLDVGAGQEGAGLYFNLGEAF